MSPRTSTTTQAPTTPATQAPTAQRDGAPAANQSVGRVLDVLEALARAGEGHVGEIADRLGVHKSTASRLLAELDRRGYVVQQGERGPYRLGVSVLRLAGAARSSLDLTQASRQVTEALADEVGETVNLAVRDEARAVNITASSAGAGIALRTFVGQTSPAHATSSGKALLAGLDESELVSLLPVRLERFTARTITERQTLVDELSLARERGWASAHDELEEGLSAVAAPVRDHTQQVVAALSISGPTFRMPAERVTEELADRARQAAAEVSERLGHWS